jgi:hypothetical protein
MARLGRRQPNRPIVQHSLRRLGPSLGAPTADATGTAHQDRLFYAANGARWWLVWIDRDLNDTLQLSWSTDLVSWTDAGTIQLRATLASNLSGTQSNNRWARNLGCAYKNIASTDVLYVFTAYAPILTDHSTWVQRITLGAGTFAVTHPEAQIGTTIAGSGALSAMGVAGTISTDNRAWAIGGYETAGLGNFRVQQATNADTGAAWTSGWNLSGQISAHTQWSKSQAIFGVGATKLLGLMDKGIVTAVADTVLQWSASPTGGGVSNWTGGGTPPDAADFTTTTAAFDLQDWAACRVSDTDVHVVVRDPDNANAFLHKRWNGTTFGAGQSIPTQATKAGAGLFAASDGTDVWLFAVDSDAANTVRYVKWTAATPAWGTWTALESSTQTRTALTGYRAKGADSNFGVMWTEDAGAGAFRIVTKPLAIAAGAIITAVGNVPATATISATAVVIQAATATIPATGTIAGTALAITTGTGTVAATATIAAAGTVIQPGVATIPATATIVAAGTRIQPATATISSTATIGATAVEVQVAAATITATATIAADATVVGAGPATILAVGNVPATATITAAGTVIQPATATVTATGTIAAAGTRIQPGTATVSGTATIQATGLRISIGAGQVNATATIAATAVVVQVATATIPATASIVGNATVSGLILATATISATATIVGVAVKVQPATATITAAATISAVGVVATPPPVPPPRWAEGTTAAAGTREGAAASSGQREGTLATVGAVEGSTSL